MVASVVLITGQPMGTQAQSAAKEFDYTHQPTLNFNYTELQLDLNIDPDPLHLEGVARYKVEPRIDSLTSLVMHARQLDVQQVMVGEQETDFTIENDSLMITFREPVRLGKAFPLTIKYRATPNFGILRDTSGTVWTSRLPRTNAHWLPVYDHPRVSFRTDLRISVPPTYQVMANGAYKGEEVVSVDRKQLRFTSEDPIPASELAFAAGPFLREEVSFGVKKIRGYFPKGLLSKARRDSMMEVAYKMLRQSENTLNQEYPYSAFQFVVLPDHHWETKAYASSVAYLYANKDNLGGQLKRSIWAQWFGSYQREEQWMDAEAMVMYQNWMKQKVDPNSQVSWSRTDVPKEVRHSMYEVFGLDHWTRWQAFFERSGSSTFRSVIDRTARNVLQRGGVYNWDDYARFWYDYSGQSWFDVPPLPNNEQEADTATYDVRIYYDLRDKQLAVSFAALENPVDELVSLPLISHRSDTTIRQNVTFTGKKDSIMFKSSASLQNVSIVNDTSHPLILQVQKPKSFWIHQLRNGENEKLRGQAARGLVAYSEEPDLQLLLDQVLKQDSSVQVQAAVYATLAEVLQGATGTQDTFLQALRSDAPSIQMEALKALTYYPDNDRVEGAVRRFVMDEKKLKLARQGIRSYAQLASDQDFNSFAKEFVTRDTSGFGIPTLLNTWIDRGEEQEVLTTAVKYTADSYTYEVRSQMISLLISNGDRLKDWLEKIPGLLQDLDPRIRYITIEALKQVPESRASSLAKEQLAMEHDVRVVEKLNSFIQ